MYTEKQKQLIIERLNYISERHLHTRFDESLDDCYGDVTIAGLEYSTSHALRNVDPIAYRSSFCDWLDSEVGETITDEIDGQYYDLKEVGDLIEEMEEGEYEKEHP